MRRSDPTWITAGFTLVELIVVLALLAIATALSVPSMARSMRARYLREDTARFLALTEYSRNEAVSQGVPMTVWIDPTGGRFGVEPKAGYDAAEGRERDFAVNPDVHFELSDTTLKNGVVEAVEFAPDGAPTTASIDTVKLTDRFGNAMTVAKTSDGWAYEIVQEAK